MSSEPLFRRLPRAIREQQMLDAAVAVFSRRGYHAAGVDEIADAARISKPMVYAYLGSKEELFVACLHREGARLIEAIAAASGESLAPDEQLWCGLRAFFEFVAGHRDGWAVLYRQARGQEPFAEVLGQLRLRMVEIVSDMLANAAATPGLRARMTETPILGYAVVGAAEAIGDWIADGAECDAEAIATEVMDTLWVGAGRLVRGETWRSRSP